MMTSITRWVLARKPIVALAWLVVTVAGFATVGAASGSFSKKFSVPGREGFATNDKIVHIYHPGGAMRPRQLAGGWQIT